MLVSKNNKPKYLYRFSNNEAGVKEEVFEIVKHTPKGYWINYPNPHKLKWVRSNSVCGFAHATRNEAYNSFIIRKRTQAQILENQIVRLRLQIKESIKLSSIKSLDDLTEYISKQDKQ